MKIVNVIGGLGNQMFQYAFALRLVEEFPKEDVLIDTSHFHYLLIKKWRTANLHNGYELDIFPNVCLRKATWWQLLKVTWPMPNYLLSRVVRRLLPVRKNEYVQPVSKYFVNDENAFSSYFSYFEGQWECIQFYMPIRNELLHRFAHGTPDSINQHYIDTIKNEDSVGIHVRRGDYLKSEVFGGICDIDYYRHGIEIILSDKAKHSFYIFSNDQEWCKENLCPLMKGYKVIYVTENSGKRSSWDMFLMSYCKDLIIANSSFSWWGAFLNQRKGRIIAPKKWFNRDAELDIWAREWIRV